MCGTEGRLLLVKGNTCYESRGRQEHSLECSLLLSDICTRECPTQKLFSPPSQAPPPHPADLDGLVPSRKHTLSPSLPASHLSRPVPEAFQACLGNKLLLCQMQAPWVKCHMTLRQADPIGDHVGPHALPLWWVFLSSNRQHLYLHLTVSSCIQSSLYCCCHGLQVLRN